MKRTDEMRLGDKLKRAANETPLTGPTLAELIDQGHLVPLPPTPEYPSDRRKHPVQRFTMAAQLQLMKALAILGWAAYFLELLRV